MKALNWITQNPWVNLVVALILIITTGQQVWTDVKSLDTVQLGAHHGVFVLGIFNALNALSGVFGNLQGIQGDLAVTEQE